jgi:hypothetical protein
MDSIQDPRNPIDKEKIMPAVIEHIDAIARRLNRDVLYLVFRRAERPRREDYRTLDERQAILQWLDAQPIGWQRCGPYASETSMSSYAGQVYIDVPFDDDNPQYLKLLDYLEFPDGTCRFADVTFYVVPLDHAMKNAHHDAPEFWEQWAERF